MKILVIVDIKNWAFDYFAKALQKWSAHTVYIHYGKINGYNFKHQLYDLILWMVDVRPDRLIKCSVPKEKVLIAIRSDVFRCKRAYYYATGIMKKYCRGFLACNQMLNERLSKLHRSWLLEGGVDTEIFRPQWKPMGKVVGWSGSLSYFGNSIKGFDFIKNACKKAGYIFKPAIREKKWRNQYEMNAYYNSIDIYVDASITAGRQNGILEAGACAKPVLATDTGITGNIIQHGKNGLVIRRKHIAEMLPKATPEIGRKLYDDILRNWTWERHAKNFDKIIAE